MDWPLDSQAVAWQALSRFVGESRDRQLVTTRALGRVLALYATTELPEAPAPAAIHGFEVAVTKHSEGGTVLRRLGMSRDEPRELWRQAELSSGAYARLPDDVMLALFPGDLWKSAASMLLDGPITATRRIDHIIDRMSRTEVVPTRARPDGGLIARASLRYSNHVARMLMYRYITLREQGHASPLLAPWRALPRAARIAGVRAPTDRSAPALALLRVVHARAVADVEQRLGVSPGGDLLEGVGRATSSRLADGGAYRPLRNLVLFELLAVLGVRRAALLAVRRKHYYRAHRSLDGRVGPALALYPGKSRDWDEISYKPLPAGLAAHLDAYIELLDRLRDGDPCAQGALFTGGVGSNTPLAPRALGRIIGGSASQRQPAMVPRQIADEPGTTTAHDGYSPHALRAAAHQMTVAGVARYCDAHGIAFEETSSEAVADCLQDRRIRTDVYGYNDFNRPWGRERWSGIAAACNWEMLTTSVGAKRRLDVVALRSAHARQAALRAEMERLQAAVNTAVVRLEQVRDAPAEVRVDRLVQLELLYRQERMLRDAVSTTDVDIERLRHDPDRRAIVPDEDVVLGKSQDVSVELAEIAATAVRQQRFREWITVSEFAELAQRAPATVRDWASGKRLPFKAGDTRNPWRAEWGRPVDESLGPRLRRIAVEGVNPAYLSPEEPGRLEEVLRRWPAGWSDSACEAPLQVGRSSEGPRPPRSKPTDARVERRSQVASRV